jgi:hypothetical protein
MHTYRLLLWGLLLLSAFIVQADMDCDTYTISGDLHNSAELDITGQTGINGQLTNSLTGDILILGGNTDITGLTVNNGRMEILHANVTFHNGLINNNTLLFDPSTITVSTLTVGPNGYLAETGDPGDRFIITEDFINQSVRNQDWGTGNTIFQFNGGARDINNPQTLETAAADLGNFTDAWLDNFVLGTLEVGTSATYLKLLDDFDNSTNCLNGLCEIGNGEAVYVNNLTLEAGTTLDLSGLNLYIRNTFTNNGGTIVNGSVTVGELPVIAGDISGDGQLDSADILLAARHVMELTVLDLAQITRGDVYPASSGDGQITLSDWLLITAMANQ